MTADEIIEGPIRGPLFEVVTEHGTIAVFEDGHVDGVPEGQVINHAAVILAVLRSKIISQRRQLEGLVEIMVDLADIPSRADVLARVRRWTAPSSPPPWQPGRGPS